MKLSRTQSLPLLLDRKGIYYGWVIVLVGSLGVLMSIPGQTMGVSVYADALIANLGLSRTQLSLSYLIGTVGSSFLLPLAGRFLDHCGARVLATFASLMLALFVALIAISPEIVAMVSHSTGLPLWVVSFVVMCFCFLGVRHFGQGQLTLASRTMIGLWFEKHRGFVFGLSGVVVSFGFGVAPLVLTELIERLEWQLSLFALSLTLITMSFVALCFYRKSPEHSGLQIDGGRLGSQTSSETINTTSSLRSMSVQEARKTLTFWIFNFGLVTQAALFTAVTFHMALIGGVNGLSSAQTFAVFLPIAVISTTTNLVSGYIADRWPLRYLLFVMQMALCTGLLGLCFFAMDLGYIVTAMGFGVSGGLFAQLSGSAWPKLFGRAYLGSISGLATSWMVFGSAIGPYYLSLGGETAQGLQVVLIAGAALPVMIAMASFFAHTPDRTASQPA